MKLIFIPVYDEGFREGYWLLSTILNGEEFDSVNLPTDYRYTDCWMEYKSAASDLVIHTKTEDVKLIEGDIYSIKETIEIKTLFNKAKKNLEKVRKEIEEEKKNWENKKPIILEVK